MSAGYGGPGGGPGGGAGGGGYGPPGGYGQPPGGAPPGGYGQPPAGAPPAGGGAFGPPAGGGAPPAGGGAPPAGGGAFGPPAGGGAPPAGGGFGQPPQAGPYGPAPAAAGGAFGAAGGAFGAAGGDANASQGTVGEMFSNFGLLAKRSLSGIAWVYFLYAILSFLLVTLPQSLVNALRMEAVISGDPLIPMGVLSILGIFTAILAIVGGVLIGTLQAGLARAARIALVEGPSALGGFGGALKASYARFLPTLGCLLLYGIGIVIGSLLCLIPGLVIAYLGMAGVYLCAAKDEGAWDSLMHSGRLTTTFIGPCAVLVVIAVVLGGIMFGVNVGLSAVLVATAGYWGTFGATLIVTLLAIPLGFIMWLLGMATFATVETAESQVAISK